MNFTFSLGDVSLLAGFIFYAGMTYRVIKQNNSEIRSLKRWQEKEAIPDFIRLKIRTGLLGEDR